MTRNDQARVSSVTQLDPRAIVAQKLRSLFPEGCRRILFVNPPNVPEEDFEPEVAKDDRYPVYPPAGFAIMSRALQNGGYPADDISILDLNFLLQEDFKKHPEAFDYDMWRVLIDKRVEEFRPDVVALTCMFTVYYRQMRRVAAHVKSIDPAMPVFAGGTHNSDAAEIVARDCRDVDIVCLFEGNASFVDTLDFVNGAVGEEKLTQLGTLDDERYVAVEQRALKTPESINIIPDYHDLPIERYSPEHGRIGAYHWLWADKTRSATVLSNIGCRAQCTFCSVRTFNGYGVSMRDIHNVVDEIELLRDRYRIGHIMWLDDDLFYDASRAVGLFNEMVRRNLGVTWDASNGIIASAMSREIAQAASESGCIALSIGIESGSPEILAAVRKPSGVRHYLQCAEIMKEFPNVFTKGLLMVGFPDETIGQVLQTVKLGVDMGLDWYTIQPLNFIPGVELTNHALAAGQLTEEEMINGTERPFVGSTGGQIRREANERVSADDFINMLERAPDIVPEREDIRDVWMVMDYRVNYEKIWALDSMPKLKMLQRLFVNMCDHTHANNALGNLYFALIEHKLGKREEAKRRLSLSRKFAKSSVYWKIRFETLDLFPLLETLEKQLA